MLLNEFVKDKKTIYFLVTQEPGSIGRSVRVVCNRQVHPASGGVIRRTGRLDSKELLMI